VPHLIRRLHFCLIVTRYLHTTPHHTARRSSSGYLPFSLPMEPPQRAVCATGRVRRGLHTAQRTRRTRRQGACNSAIQTDFATSLLFLPSTIYRLLMVPAINTERFNHASVLSSVRHLAYLSLPLDALLTVLRHPDVLLFVRWRRFLRRRAAGCRPAATYANIATLMAAMPSTVLYRPCVQSPGGRATLAATRCACLNNDHGIQTWRGGQTW